jgi:hypothetical protein
MHDYNTAQRAADALDGITGKLSDPSRAEWRRYLTARYEYLALRAEAR